MLAEEMLLYFTSVLDGGFFMKEERDIEKEKVDYNQIFIKVLPYIISGLAILTIGLSMIGNFFMLKEKVDGEKIYKIYKLGDVLFNNPFGTPIQIYLILIYLVFPLLACIFIDLRKFFKESITISVLLFLLSAISMILAAVMMITMSFTAFAADIPVIDMGTFHNVYNAPAGSFKLSDWDYEFTNVLTEWISGSSEQRQVCLKAVLPLHQQI